MFELSEQEKVYKWNHAHGWADHMKRPLFLQECLQVEPRDAFLNDQLLRYHETAAPDARENTIKDTAVYGDQIKSVLHLRYSLPLMHDHDYIELAYVWSGSCMHFVENQRFPMKTGDVCILAPKAMHAISVEDDDTVIINIMMSRKLFDYSFLRMLKGDKIISEFLEHILYNKRVSPYLMFPTGEDRWLHATVRLIYEENSKKDYLYHESMELYVKQLFIHLIRHYQEAAIVTDRIDQSQNRNVMALLGYISVNYNHVTLRNVADYFGYSETYLGQILQRYTGRSFRAIVNDLQMEHARLLLEEQDMSITRISSEVGCYDASHFTRKFKARFGMTPKLYRSRKRTALREHDTV